MATPHFLDLHFLGPDATVNQALRTAVVCWVKEQGPALRGDRITRPGQLRPSGPPWPEGLMQTGVSWELDARHAFVVDRVPSMLGEALVALSSDLGLVAAVHYTESYRDARLWLFRAGQPAPALFAFARPLDELLGPAFAKGPSRLAGLRLRPDAGPLILPPLLALPEAQAALAPWRARVERQRLATRLPSSALGLPPPRL